MCIEETVIIPFLIFALRTHSITSSVRSIYPVFEGIVIVKVCLTLFIWHFLSYCGFAASLSLFYICVYSYSARGRDYSEVVFFRSSAVVAYLESDNVLSRRDFELPCDNGKERKALYMECLRRAIVSTLFCTGLRRAELISLNLDSLDAARGVLRVVGKGDKMREIPLVPACIQEISLYLQAACTLLGEAVEHPAPLFLSFKCKRLTPNQVDKAVKDELEQAGKDFAGRRSPHVLRHSYATALLEGGAGLDSIKEVLGHANLAATQIYTHSNPAQLKRIYKAAHPRSGKKDGKD